MDIKEIVKQNAMNASLLLERNFINNPNIEISISEGILVINRKNEFSFLKLLELGLVQPETKQNKNLDIKDLNLIDIPCSNKCKINKVFENYLNSFFEIF